MIAASTTTRYVAWISTLGGIPAVYVATESGSSWSQLAGSAQGGGISGLLQAASEPAIALLASGQPIVAWTAQTRSGNRIENNTTGVVATVDNADGGFGFVSGSGINFISNNTTGVQLSGEIQNQNISGNQVGVTGSGVIGGSSLAFANDINGNVVGVSGFKGTIQFSRIDGNGTGILASTNRQILHNLIYNNTTVGLEVSGASNIRTSDNTFYTSTGDNIRIENASSNVEILNPILWALNGYGIYIANDSQAGYFSDYNTLFAGSGPQPALPSIGANYLINSGFENGLGSWTASPGSSAASAGQQTGYPTAFDGSSYYAAGAVQQGTVSQTVNLLSQGLTAAQIDAGGLNLIFGGRVISANAFPPDQGQITVTMLAADGKTILGNATALAPNATNRWALVGGTTTVLVEGTRFVGYTFTATRQPGETYDEAFLDDAFVSTASTGAATEDGPYQAPAVTDPTVAASEIVLTSPVLYVNWIDNAPHVITWDNFGNAGALNQSVDITLYQETSLGSGLPSEPKFLETIATAVANTGSYTWIPMPSTVPYGTYGLLVQVSLVSDPAVTSRSTEPFTVPENGSTYYVNDGSTANDQYTTAAGSNRHDGKLPGEALPNIDNVLRQYSLTSGSVIYVDPGSYPMIDPFDVSGNQNYGLGLDQGFKVQGPANGSAVVLTPAIPGNPVNLIQLEHANLVTINDLTLQNAGRGVYVQNSTGFSATGLTISGMADEGVRIDTNSAVTLLANLTVTGSGLAGVYISGTAGTISNADITNSGTSVPDCTWWGRSTRSAARSATMPAGASTLPTRARSP